jgi:glutathione transport system substrate-binding protein
MKPLIRMLAIAAATVAIAAPAFAAKDIVFAVASTFTTTDPYDANDTLSQAMAKSFYEGLYGFDKDMKMIPVLAEGYDVSKDGLVYTIKLRKGVKFHDGTDFKADAVKVNLDRVTNPENKLKRYGLYNNNIAKTEVVDDSSWPRPTPLKLHLWRKRKKTRWVAWFWIWRNRWARTSRWSIRASLQRSRLRRRPPQHSLLR